MGGRRLHLDLAAQEVVQHGLDLDLLVPDHGEGQLQIHKERFPDRHLERLRDAETWDQEMEWSSSRSCGPGAGHPVLSQHRACGVTLSGLEADGHKLPRGHGIGQVLREGVGDAPPGRGKTGASLSGCCLTDPLSKGDHHHGGLSGSPQERRHHERVLLLGEPLGPVFPSREGAHGAMLRTQWHHWGP